MHASDTLEGHVVADLSFDALLCDVDGVLRRWDAVPTPELEKKYVVPAGKLDSIAFAPHRLEPALTGQVSDEEWRASIARAMLPYCGSVDRAAALVREWSAHQGLVDDEVLDLLIQVRRSVPVVLVSNATTRLERDLAELGLDGVADEVLSSARVGVAKPDPRIFRAAATRVRVPASRCLLVDDTAEHVHAARSIGMRAVRYEGIDRLRPLLAPVLLATG